MLFETISDLDMFYVSRQIRTALSNYEPRIDNIKVDTTFYPSKNTIYCEIRYDIIKLNITITQNVNIERVR
jgi:predicted component of type VI protein secretion system